MIFFSQMLHAMVTSNLTAMSAIPLAPRSSAANDFPVAAKRLKREPRGPSTPPHEPAQRIIPPPPIQQVDFSINGGSRDWRQTGGSGHHLGNANRPPSPPSAYRNANTEPLNDDRARQRIMARRDPRMSRRSVGNDNSDGVGAPVPAPSLPLARDDADYRSSSSSSTRGGDGDRYRSSPSREYERSSRGRREDSFEDSYRSSRGRDSRHDYEDSRGYSSRSDRDRSYRRY